MKVLLGLVLSIAAIKCVGIVLKMLVVGVKIAVGFFKLSLGVTFGLVNAVASAIVVFLGFALFVGIVKSLLQDEEEING